MLFNSRLHKMSTRVSPVCQLMPYGKQNDASMATHLVSKIKMYLLYFEINKFIPSHYGKNKCNTFIILWVKVPFGTFFSFSQNRSALAEGISQINTNSSKKK